MTRPDDECINCFDLRSDHKATPEPHCEGEGKEDGEWVCDCEEFEEDEDES